MRTPPATLYHFTCSDMAERVRRDGLLKPRPHPYFPPTVKPVVWLTDLPAVNPRVVGLTRHQLPCDRTAVRFAVPGADCMWWPDFARRERIEPDIREVLEGAPGRLPAHWWVSVAGIWLPEEEALSA